MGECSRQLKSHGDLTDLAVDYQCALMELFSHKPLELESERRYLQACGCLNSWLPHQLLSEKPLELSMREPEGVTVVKHIVPKQLNADCQDFERVLDMIERARTLHSRRLLITDLVLTQIPSSLSGLSESLEQLTLEELDLHRIPESIRSLKKLTKLVIKGCPVYYTPSWLSELANLTELRISRCRLVEFPESHQPPNLLVLDLSYNNLVTLGLPSTLVYLDVSGNSNLNLFPDPNAPFVPQLQVLILSGTRTLRMPGSLRPSLQTLEWRDASTGSTFDFSEPYPNLKYLALMGSASESDVDFKTVFPELEFYVSMDTAPGRSFK